MRPESHVKNIKEATKRAMEQNNSQTGTPNGILTSITMGDVNGIRELQNTKGDSGLFIAAKPM